VTPVVDGGRYPVKRVIGDRIEVSCDLVSDGHDVVAGALLFRAPDADPTRPWRRAPLRLVENDRYTASFVADQLGLWEFAVEAWICPIATWRQATSRKVDAGRDVRLELATGARLFARAAERAQGQDAAFLRRAAAALDENEGASAPATARLAAASDPAVLEAVSRHPDLTDASRSPGYAVRVDPPRARCSAWYELFPRSAGRNGPDQRHGTLRDCVRLLPYVARMGFDVLYLPPIHPIGRTRRKGRDNAPQAGPADVGSPWAIGAAEGGHKAIHPELGTLADLRDLVGAARKAGIELALDIAFQASPDHPYLAAHPEWFKRRPDGSVQCAENPPKVYEDVVPFDFECQAWESLWRELASIFHFWCDQGIRVFRVDNPHTKSLGFWEWCLADVQAAHPDVIFLSEAFTRPKLMYALAKCGFTQSYTYFTWRHTKKEFVRFMQELTQPPVADFYRPNFWPTTPDILPEHLQYGGRPAFVQRLVLAATLSSNYGIYGPAFELMEHLARPGSEEYAENEKYQLRAWNLDREGSLRDIVALVNRVRREHPALEDNLIAFHRTENDQLLAYSKRSRDGTDVVLVVVNLDVNHTQSGFVDLDLLALGITSDEPFQVHDLLAEERYRWQGTRAYVRIDPHVLPASIFAIRRRLRSERDFDYFA
jgi:starch synthase (maltosyl-transferring)